MFATGEKRPVCCQEPPLSQNSPIYYKHTQVGWASSKLINKRPVISRKIPDAQFWAKSGVTFHDLEEKCVFIYVDVGVG